MCLRAVRNRNKKSKRKITEIHKKKAQLLPKLGRPAKNRKSGQNSAKTAQVWQSIRAAAVVGETGENKRE